MFGVIKVISAKMTFYRIRTIRKIKNFRVLGVMAAHDPGVITTNDPGVITTPWLSYNMTAKFKHILTYKRV